MEKQLGDCPQWDGFQPISLLGSSEVWCLVLGPPVRRRWCSLILDICIRGLGVAAQSQEIVSSNPGQSGRPGTNGVPAAKWDPTTHDSDKRETRNGGRKRRKERKRKWSQGAHPSQASDPRGTGETKPGRVGVGPGAPGTHLRPSSRTGQTG